MQLNFTGLHYEVDNKVWTKSVGTQEIFRVDLETGDWEKFRPLDQLPGVPARRHLSGDGGLPQQSVDGRIHRRPSGQIDAKTGAVTWYATPTAHARARRMEIDAQDRVLVTEYRTSKAALFDPKTEQFTEYSSAAIHLSLSRQFDKNGEIWASTMSTDRVVRLDPEDRHRPCNI